MEMKKEWKRPLTVVEKFVPNEFIASACGESGVVYKFECNAGESGKHYDVTTGIDGSGNLTKNSWFSTNYYHPCNDTHNAESDSGFIKGYLWANNGSDRFSGYTPIPVIIWTDNGTNVHCTTELDMTKWETAKS